tara:strand:+ start:915 stop:1544 length:630 start_codon:yes stop_codon:yes gene_type:complete
MMNIAKYLLIDVGLVIAAIPLLILLKGRNKRSSLFSIPNNKELLEKTYINLPDKEKLLELEELAIKETSGIDFDSLLGDWKFVSVWEKDSNDENFIFSSLLRVFSANLEIKNNASPQDRNRLSISSSIQFGLLSIKFSGSGNLKGKQPFLNYSLNLIEFKSGSNILLSRSIMESAQKEKSFFALIASNESFGWLSARVQGGSLVLLLRD